MNKIIGKQKIPQILHIVHSFGAGGLENGMVNILNRIPENKYKHIILSLTDDISFKNRITNKNVKIISINKKPGKGVGWYLDLIKIVCKVKPDIIHTRNLSTIEAQIPCMLMSGCKRIHGEHGRDVFDLTGQTKKYVWLRKAISIIIDRYLTVSKDLEDWLVRDIKITDNKIFQIYNGVDTNIFYPHEVDKSNNQIIIGSVGRLAAIKNYQLLIKAYSKLLQVYHDIDLRLIFVGDGPEKINLISLSEELGISDKVKFYGNRNDIPDLLRKIDIFVLPSLGEGVSNTILEAMSTSLPIVASEVGGNVELVNNGVNGFLFHDDDQESLCGALKLLIDEPNLRRKMGKESLNSVLDSFQWDITVSKYMQNYDELLSK